MNSKLFLVSCVLLLLSCLSNARFSQPELKASDSFPVHNLSTGLNYTIIQEAIDANETSDGQTILVDSGEYNETVVLNKSISLVGENSNSTIINPTYNTPPSPPINPFGAIINVTASNAEVTGFNLAWGWYINGIITRSCNNITIRDNVITSAGSAINLDNSTKSTIAENVLIGHGLEGNDLVALLYCSRCTINNNSISGSTYYGITLFSSSNNQIYDNLISQNQFGLDISDDFKGNIGSGNNVFHNNFEENYHQVSGAGVGNYFNGSSEGNYWSDYNGKDADQDGIGDTPYANLDYHPLIGPFGDFIASIYDVQTISNSTISNFYFNGTAIDFDVSGEKGTTGFCRICIPTGLISPGYRILVNGTEIQYKLLPNSNSTQSYLYFTYHESTQEVVITIPEFPFFLILSLFMITTLLSATIFRIRRNNTHRMR